MKTAIKFVAITALLTFATTSTASAQEEGQLQRMLRWGADLADEWADEQNQAANQQNMTNGNGWNGNAQQANGQQTFWGNQNQSVPFNQGQWGNHNQAVPFNQGQWGNGGSQNSQITPPFNGSNQQARPPFNGNNGQGLIQPHHSTGTQGSLVNFLTSISGEYASGSFRNTEVGTLTKVGNVYRWSDNMGKVLNLSLDADNRKLDYRYADQFGQGRADSFQFDVGPTGDVKGFYHCGRYFTRTP